MDSSQVTNLSFPEPPPPPPPPAASSNSWLWQVTTDWRFLSLVSTAAFAVIAAVASYFLGASFAAAGLLAFSAMSSLACFLYLRGISLQNRIADLENDEGRRQEIERLDNLRQETQNQSIDLSASFQRVRSIREQVHTRSTSLAGSIQTISQTANTLLAQMTQHQAVGGQILNQLNVFMQSLNSFQPPTPLSEEEDGSDEDPNSRSLSPLHVDQNPSSMPSSPQINPASGTNNNGASQHE